MRNIKLTIEFDGTRYKGWQKQKEVATVQGTIEKAIKKITKEEEIELHGSSRTDAGVHAKGMVASFLTKSRVPAEKFREAINTKLPDDIAIIKSEEVDENFHARFSSKGKMYSYTIVNRVEKVALMRNYSYQVKDELDLQKMKEACKYIVGKHDFNAFKSAGSTVKTSIRTVHKIDIIKKDDIIKIYVSGDGFLYNMVRIIVGTLLEVGKNKIKPEDVKSILDSKDRRNAGPCVPPNGLVLEKVFYSEEEYSYL